MAKFKIFTYILFLVFSTNIIAQTNIDSVSFSVSFPEKYLDAHVKAIYYTNKVAHEFSISDTANYNFLWSGTSIPVKANLNSAIYRFDNAGTYEVKLSVTKKSTATEYTHNRDVTITAPLVLDVPNVFSPNNDGVNDFFKIFYDGIKMLEIVIFTRTGTKVFESESPTIVWDGRNSSGSELSEGVYFYVLKSEVLEKDQTGFVHLYRNNK